MRKILSYIIILCIVTACAPYEEGQKLYDVPVSLVTDYAISDDDVITVTLTSNTSCVYKQDIKGTETAHFMLPAGIYQVAASGSHDEEYNRIVWNGNMADLIVGDKNDSNVMGQGHSVKVQRTIIDLANPLLIKEIYAGGCQKDDGSGKFLMDKCIILYNNSAYPKSLDGVCIGMIDPYNAEATSHLFLNNGVLDYESEDWVPAINGYWYFKDGEAIQPYSELVVAVNGAIDHTLTYKNSVNYANSAYYAMYDPETIGLDGTKYNNASNYPAPSYLIPDTHHLKAVKYGSGTAWPLSATSPAIILFQVKDTTPLEYINDNIIYPPSKEGNKANACARIPREWVLDAVEVFKAQDSKCKKRLTPDLDNGSVALTGGYGHSLLRKSHVNDAGKTIYEDTDNSTNDFIEIDNCTLR